MDATSIPTAVAWGWHPSGFWDGSATRAAIGVLLALGLIGVPTLGAGGIAEISFPLNRLSTISRDVGKRFSGILDKARPMAMRSEGGKESKSGRPLICWAANCKIVVPGKGRTPVS